MKLIDDIFKDIDGRWKLEKIASFAAILIFHGSAYVQRQQLSLQDYAVSVGILHAVLFTTNGLKTFLEKKVPNIQIKSEETNVTTP